MLWACFVTEAMLGLNFYGQIFEGAHNGIGSVFNLALPHPLARADA